MKMIPKSKIDAQNQLFYAYNSAAQNVVATILEIREASQSETFDGTDAQLTILNDTEYGKSETGKLTIKTLQDKILIAIEAGKKASILNFKSILPDLVSRAIQQKASNKEMK